MKTSARVVRVTLIVLAVVSVATGSGATDFVPTAGAASPPLITTIGATASAPAKRISLVGHFGTLPPGSDLPSAGACAALVRPAPEIRPENTAANNNRGSRANANTRTDWSGFTRVDGDFAGTTDQLIQWAACKWGIDEDIVRAQMIKESGWYQSGIGDNGESFGIGQVRTTAHPSAFQFAINARTSTAYNLDYTYSIWRAGGIRSTSSRTTTFWT